MILRLTVLVVVFGLAACGGATMRPAATAVATATRSPSTTAAAAGKTETAVTIKNFEFGPRTVHVARGARVTWTNSDTTNHTVTFSQGPGDRGNVNPGVQVSAQFTRAGTFAYVCQYHPNMHGRVVVG